MRTVRTVWEDCGGRDCGKGVPVADCGEDCCGEGAGGELWEGLLEGGLWGWVGGGGGRGGTSTGSHDGPLLLAEALLAGLAQLGVVLVAGLALAPVDAQRGPHEAVVALAHPVVHVAYHLAHTQRANTMYSQS